MPDQELRQLMATIASMAEDIRLMRESIDSLAGRNIEMSMQDEMEAIRAEGRDPAAYLREKYSDKKSGGKKPGRSSKHCH